jgi:excinuclease ABC subunit C
MDDAGENAKNREGLLAKQLKSLPKTPGVYQFKDDRGNVMYVGKARNLRQRVRQYFAASSSDSRFFIHTIRKSVSRVETISTADEGEALILENNLIKELRPKYNVRLRDDKNYLCLRVDLRAPWPRFELVRRPVKDGARYFGPYHSAHYAKDLYRFLGRHFMLRTCKDSVFKSRTRPCLQHQIGRCLGPCTLPVDDRLYRKSMQEALMVLEGKTEELKGRLTEEMRERSRALEYESAARLRDLIAAVSSLDEKQRVVDVRRPDTDVVGMAREMDRVLFVLMFIRGGKVIGMAPHRFARVGSDDEETLRSFLVQYYGEDHYIPREILIPGDMADRRIVESVIRRRREDKVRLQAPSRGRGRDLVRMAQDNAVQALGEWEKLEDASASRLAAIAARLRLPRVPDTIECVDISHTAGREAVGSRVVMKHGELARSLYRRFKVRTEAGGDDFMAMREVLERRLIRGARGEKGWDLPDLLLIDGGKGHLKLATMLVRDLNIEDLAVAAIAKDRRREQRSAARRRVMERIQEEYGEADAGTVGDGGASPRRARAPKSFDTVYVEGHKDGVPASAATPLGLLMRLRDEAHRFAVGYHRKLRSRKALSSDLLAVKGVGGKIVARLYENFVGPDEIRSASVEDVARKASISLKLAAAIKAHLEKK